MDTVHNNALISVIRLLQRGGLVLQAMRIAQRKITSISRELTKLPNVKLIITNKYFIFNILIRKYIGMYLNFENGITCDFNFISDFNGLDI